MKENKTYKPLPVPKQAIKAFQRAYPRGVRIFAALYPNATLNIRKIVQARSVAWQGYKKSVKWLDYGASYIFGQGMDLRNPIWLSHIHQMLVEALIKMGGYSTCPRWSELGSIFPPKPELKKFWIDTYCKRHKRDRW